MLRAAVSPVTFQPR